MKKATLIVILLLTAMLMQYCNKDSVSATSTNGAVLPLQAFINDSTWTPVPPNYSFGVIYVAATQSRVFSFTGTSGTQQLSFTVTVPKSSSVGNGFPLGVYSVDTLTNLVQMNYAILSPTMPNVYVQQGTVESGSPNSVTVTAIDSVNMTITGTFAFQTTQLIYKMGIPVSIYANNILGGAFNSIPYTFKKQ